MSVLAVACLCVTVASCDKNESYAEKLDNESKASNAYLSGFDVVNEIPADTIFEEGEDARGHDAGHGKGKHDAEHGSQPAASVHHGGFLHFHGHGVDEALDHQNAEGQGERGIGQHEARLGVEEGELHIQDVKRDEQHEHGEHLRHEHADENGVARLEAQPRQGVSLEGGQHHGDDHGGQR